MLFQRFSITRAVSNDQREVQFSLPWRMPTAKTGQANQASTKQRFTRRGSMLQVKSFKHYVQHCCMVLHEAATVEGVPPAALQHGPPWQRGGVTRERT